jgi:hypothetical protein
VISASPLAQQRREPSQRENHADRFRVLFSGTTELINLLRRHRGDALGALHGD